LEKKANNIWIKSSLDAYKIKQNAEVTLTAYSQLIKKDKATALSYGSYQIKTPYPYCPYENKPCDPYQLQYRQIDGSCNNLNANSTWWGATLTPFKRVLPAVYDDYVSAPRTRSVIDGEYLPNPRSVAMKVFAAQKSVSEWTQFMTYFGQFVDHDITATEVSTYSDGYRKICPCGSYDPDCFNIPIPREDRVNYGGARCQSFVRSTPGVRDFNCNLGPREQINAQTSWVDLSGLYGWTPETGDAVRWFEDGLMLADETEYGQIFPQNLTSCPSKMSAREYSRRHHCFVTGKFFCLLYSNIQENRAK
jgi:hypothetical protein